MIFNFALTLVGASFLFLGVACDSTSATTDTGSGGEFCGWSTNGACSANDDCRIGGCSSHVCESTNDPPTVTTCEYTECYDAAKYNMECGCVSNACQWSKIKAQ